MSKREEFRKGLFAHANMVREGKGYIRERVRVAHRAFKTYSQNAYVIGRWFTYGDEGKIWKQLFLMDEFYKMYPEREPGNG